MTEPMTPELQSHALDAIALVGAYYHQDMTALQALWESIDHQQVVAHLAAWVIGTNQAAGIEPEQVIEQMRAGVLAAGQVDQ